MIPSHDDGTQAWFRLHGVDIYLVQRFTQRWNLPATGPLTVYLKAVAVVVSSLLLLLIISAVI
jgi:hypothetical protein